MKVVCISCSNIQASKDQSTSLKLSTIIQDLCIRIDELMDFVLFDLRQFTFIPCDGCGACLKLYDGCCKDGEYTRIVETINNADVLFIVSPHYAPIPAKLTMLLEKLEQNTFLKRFNDETYRSPLYGKPVGIIGHGGGTQEVSDWYKGVIIESIANALSYPIEMKSVDYDNDNKAGIIVPVEKVLKHNNSIFPIQEYDWESIRKIVKEYTEKVIRSSRLYCSMN